MLIDSIMRVFSEALNRDLGVDITPLADGQIHRIDSPRGRPGNASCWYILFPDGVPAGAYGDWSTGDQFKWRASNQGEPSPPERERLGRSRKSAQLQRDADRLARQKRATDKAREFWKSSGPVSHHPYLQKKRIPAGNARELGTMLLVPLINTSGDLVNLQRIYPDGKKRFLSGGQIKGCFSLLGAETLPEVGHVYVSEGWATAVTLHLKTQKTVLAAMCAGNLKSVATKIKERHPDLQITIAADNDHRTLGNPGMVKGQEAARAVNGELHWPRSCSNSCVCTDFNDQASCQKFKESGREW